MGNCAACGPSDKSRLIGSGNIKTLAVDEFKMF